MQHFLLEKRKKHRSVIETVNDKKEVSKITALNYENFGNRSQQSDENDFENVSLKSDVNM